MKDLFLLDPDVIFLNHGSFGACPKPVFEIYQQWQLTLERQPVLFLGRRYDELMNEARAALAAYVHTESRNLVFVPNATIAVNTLARSLHLAPGDEILTTNHEYGAMDYTWEFICRKSGARYIHQEIPLPVTTHTDFIERFWEGVTPRTKVIFLSHITSPTALIFPVQAICQRAREAGILTVIDGAHALGQIPVDLTAIDADFYTANCHKWLCAPKGSAFFYAHPRLQTQIDPLVISWGWTAGADFVTQNQWQGTRDIAAFLSVPAAIAFQAKYNWEAVRAGCHNLARQTRTQLAAITGLESIMPDSADWFAQMVSIPLPPCDPVEFQRQLYGHCNIEIPVMTWNDKQYLRASFQGYNTPQDVAALAAAVTERIIENR